MVFVIITLLVVIYIYKKYKDKYEILAQKIEMYFHKNKTSDDEIEQVIYELWFNPNNLLLVVSTQKNQWIATVNTLTDNTTLSGL